MNEETKKEIENILTELQYEEIFTKLKNLPTIIRTIRLQKDERKAEKDNIVNELQHREIELLETVYIDALEWKDKKKPNNEESRKNYLELLKHKDSVYQTSKAKLSTTEISLNRLNTAYEESENRLKTSIALKDMINARIDLIISFKEGEKQETKSEKLPEVKINKEDMEHISLGK